MKKEIKHTQKNPRPMPKRLNNTVFMTYFENLRDEKVTHIRELITVSGTGLFIWVNVIIVFTVSSQTKHFLWTLHKHMRCWLINKTMLYKLQDVFYDVLDYLGCTWTNWHWNQIFMTTDTTTVCTNLAHPKITSHSCTQN